MSCETETGPVVYKDQVVPEGSTALLTLFLTDESSADLALADLQSLVLTLQDEDSETPINGRSAQTILNANGGSVAELTVEGVTRLRLQLVLSALDNILVDADKDLESHSALVVWGYDTTHTGKIAVIFSVQRL